MRGIGKVLVVGSCCIFNRTPNLIAEIARRAQAFKCIQKTYYTHNGSSWFFARALLWLFAFLHYQISLPFSVWKANWVFLSASNNPELPAVAFWARAFNKPVLVDYYVSFFEWACLMMRITKPDSRRARKFIRADRLAMAQVGVIHFNRCEIEHICRLLPDVPVPSKLHLIPLFTDFDSWVLEQRSPRAITPVRFVWWGSLMPLHGLETILNAFSEVAKTRSDFELHLCFFAADSAADLLSKYPRNQFPWLRVQDGLALADGSLPRFVNEFADVGFSHFGTGEQAEYVGSNKIIEAMALGRTSIVADTAGNRELPRLHELFIVSQRSVDALAETIMGVLERPEVLLEKGGLCRDAFLSTYSERVVRRKFAGVIDEFLEDCGLLQSNRSL